MIVLKKFDSQEEYFDFKALLYSERFGILNYKVENGVMSWVETYVNEGTFFQYKDFKTDKTYAYMK